MQDRRDGAAASGSSMIRKSLPQACAFTNGIMLILLCLSVPMSVPDSALWLRWCIRRRPRLDSVDTGTWLSGRAQNRQLGKALRDAPRRRLRHGISRNCDNIGRMFCRRGQCRLQAVVISFIDGLPQRNSRVSATRQHGPSCTSEWRSRRKASATRAPAQSRNGTLVVELAFASFNTSGTRYIMPIVFSAISSRAIGCISRFQAAATRSNCASSHCHGDNANSAKRGQHLHAITRVVVRVRPSCGIKIGTDHRQPSRHRTAAASRAAATATPPAANQRATKPANRGSHHQQSRSPRTLRRAAPCVCRTPAPRPGYAIRDNAPTRAVSSSFRSRQPSRARA